jgi:hypothetical protein
MKHLLAVVFVIFSVPAFNQTPGKSPYDAFMKTFYSRMDTVEWLCAYDNIAWVTSDSVFASSKEEQAKLGSEWFCFPQNGLWHAVYGKYQDNQFNMVFHYSVDSNNRIVRTKQHVDTNTLNSYSRALVYAAQLHEKFPDSQKIRFNQYIKRNPDKTISVWLLPAFTTSNIAVYGGEFYYLFDATGNTLIKRNEFSIGYKGFKPDPKKEIRLPYGDFSDPPLSAVFFVWYYKDYFDKIILDTKKFSSSVIRDTDHYTWIHAAKEE